jgi:hypothetical protein
MRHTAAHRRLAAGGSEGGLMSVAGWSRRNMLLGYTRARAEQRAAGGGPAAEPGGAVSGMLEVGAS